MRLNTPSYHGRFAYQLAEICSAVFPISTVIAGAVLGSADIRAWLKRKRTHRVACIGLLTFTFMGVASGNAAAQQSQASPTPKVEFKITHLQTDALAIGTNRTAPLFTQEVGGYAKLHGFKVNFFSFGDFTPRQSRILDIQVNSQTVSYAKLPAIRFMAEESKTAKWAARMGPAVDVNQVPGVGKYSKKVLKVASVAWLKGVMNEPFSQVKFIYATKPWQWKGTWGVDGFVRWKFGRPDVYQPGLTYTRKSWHGISLRLEYNRDASGQRLNFGPSLDLLKLLGK